MWQNLLRQCNKKLRISISINYMEDNSRPSRRTDKRGSSPATNRILRERDDQIDAEDSSGQPSVWRDVYRKMRCPGRPCHHEGQYCWQDPEGKKHYKLSTHHLKALVKYVEQGGIIETRDGIPDNVREQLYAEDRQRLLKRNKSRDSPTESMPPQININVLLAQSFQPSISSSCLAEANPRTIQGELVDIPGLLDLAVEEYTDWHLSRVSAEGFKANIKKARDVALDNYLDLKQLCGENPDFFCQAGGENWCLAGSLATSASGSSIVSKIRRVGNTNDGCMSRQP